MGHVPPRTVRVLRACGDLQGRQHRGAPREGAVAIPSQARRALGAYGEARVAEWYLAQGYELLGRNWRCRDGEIDLVARRGHTVVFCEVKTRSGTSFGLPAEAVNPSKQARIRRLAARWLSEHRDCLGRGQCTLRFDVASVLQSKVDVLEAAF